MNQTVPNPTTLACRRYLRQMAGMTVVYLIVLYVSVTQLRHIHTGTLHYLIALVPLVPVALLVPIFIGYYRNVDEFERRMQTESLAIAGGITAVLGATYGFLELAGLPNPSAWWTWTVFMVTWAIVRPIVGRHYSR
ncbi:MAG TPA: hypothetical protein VGG89_06220 [Candidatus Baltobacteraceae bacterium]|jgi:hypothetical protein